MYIKLFVYSDIITIMLFLIANYCDTIFIVYAKPIFNSAINYSQLISFRSLTVKAKPNCTFNFQISSLKHVLESFNTCNKSSVDCIWQGISNRSRLFFIKSFHAQMIKIYIFSFNLKNYENNQKITSEVHRVKKTMYYNELIH